MQRFTWVLLLLLAASLSSCSYYDHKTKQTFYDELSGTNDSLDRMTMEWHQLLYKAISSKNFSALAPLRSKMGEFVSRNRSKIANIEVPPNSDGIRDSEEVFLSNQANTISEAYPAFEPFNDITPIEDIQNHMKLVTDDLEAETGASAAIRKSLQDLAQKNALKTLPVVR